MSSTSKVLGTIGALNTLIENFPMSLLDLFKTKTYTSVFEFVMDLLYACGIDTNEILEYVINEIYSIVPDIEGGLSGLQDNIAAMDFTKVQQSEFISALEKGIKGILQALLASMYGCSAIPVLPNKYMDYPNAESFNGFEATLWRNQIYPYTMEIPVKLIDPMGILENSPTTSEGRIYYDIQGRDVLYEKVAKNNISGFNIHKKTNNGIFLLEKNENNKTILYFNTENELPENLAITIGYFDEKMNNLLIWESNIKIANIQSDDGLIIKDGNKILVSNIKWIKLNGKLNNCNLEGNIYCYLSSILSNVNLNTSLYKDIKWGENNNYNILGTSEGNNDVEEYEYQAIGLDSEKFKKAVRKKSVPRGTITENDPQYIKIYEGIDSNNLYRSFDLNAFIWYTLNKSSRASQIEINHTMWDSRNSALKQGINLDNNIWNNWYASKSGATDEFKYKDNKLYEYSSLYPIIQLKKSKNNLYGLNINFPAQRYFKPKTRENLKDPNLTFNASIYRFNKEYLDSIQILKPKLMLSGFVNYLLGFAMDMMNSVNVNFSKKVIENKLSSAVEKIIEADDMEIEDCYTTFSNEEFDGMLEEMLLSRYTATYYGGETNKVKTHDVEYYMSLIDSFNASTTKEESISTVTKLVNEITVTPGQEGSINYGIEASIDTSFLKKLLWGITMPIVQSLFTPQVMLLIIVNMHLTGVVKIDEFANNDFGKILNLLLNKILGLMKSIIKFIKDMIIELLLKLLMKKLTPLLIKYMEALEKERLEYWINILMSALACLPTLPIFNIKRAKIGGIDEVDYADYADYADIVPKNAQTSTPESMLPC